MKNILLMICMIALLMMGCVPQGSDSDSNGASGDESNPIAGVTLTGFEAQELSGAVIDQSYFAHSKLTVVNIWGTFCGPCIDEMPGLEKVSKEFEASDVQMLGIVIDDPSDEEAIALLRKLGVTYDNVKPDAVLADLVVSQFDYVPVTLFVDSEGIVYEDFIPGSTSEDDLTVTIEVLLKQAGE